MFQRSTFLNVLALVTMLSAVGAQPPTPPPPGPVVAGAPLAVPTHYEFAKAFQPLPGEHRVVLLHPYTCCPVEVCFKLPCGLCPRRVCADRNDIEIQYGLIRQVKIQFYRDGSYKVKYRLLDA